MLSLYILNVKLIAQNIEYYIAMEIFATRLTDLRNEKHLSQAQLAKMIGSSCSIVCYWETNRSEPTAPYLVKLADIFDVSIDYLLGRKEF